MRLTNAKVASAENTTDKPIWLHDDELTGLALSVSPKGKKVFYVNAWQDGRTYREKLGVFPRVTATEARDLAKVILGELAKGREYQKKAKARKLTVGDLWEDWFINHSKRTKRTWARDENNYTRLVKPVLHHVLLADVERSDIDKLVGNVEGLYGKGPANKARGLLSTMFEWAIKKEPKWMDSNPVKGTHRPAFEPRQRYLKESEVKAFFKALDSIRSEKARDYFRMLLWTGQRKANVASMEWAELDWHTGEWIIPTAKYKAKRPHVVPLSAPALEILLRRHAERIEGAKYVFPGRGQKGYYSDPKGAWELILKAAGLQDLRIHDLRRSLGAWQNNTGESLRIIQATLGHSAVSTTAKFYTPTERETIRASVEGVNARMLAAAKGGDQ
jgi:integrase